ncbi:pilus assembly protein PilM [Caldicellulosiruptor changbaiensis]|uniref:Pilus assembly protein PilM n=1 Tax=Caldicellulosiruptor changbaiensis TaxID=1222016 RepID=A0A3T0D6Y9_9FIRM|nr:pilus assembly protein PilM [Caldicellulosiruptor changbaiensis]AZT90857.1 pilus assembly protein PilM [Caldicellulosiruptor changbaiensis]
MSIRVALEVGKNYVKVAEGSFTNALHVNRFAEEQSKDDIIINDLKLEPNLFYETVGNIFLKNNFPKNNVIVVLTGISNMIIREMVIPYLNEEKTYNLITFEARQYFPTNIENYIIDYKQLKVFNEGKVKKQKILLVALPKTLIEDIINISRKLGLKLKKIDIEPNAITKLVNIERRFRKEKEKELVMIVNIMRSYITTVIVNEGDIILSKTFPNYDLERMFNEEEESEAFLEYIYTYTINEIAENVSKFYEFYRSKDPESPKLSKVYLMGEVCQHIDISDILRTKINSEMVLLTELQSIDKKIVMTKNEICNYSTVMSGLI